ncbi:MAG TPA: prepilin-type N-terminal cleavage/methylation domain-containing protein [Phycisphaerae bacterium]|nr:prepilin-type N-terminal cleavage/methylation domain-containing protein [Phycisphaerae bacterium]
MRGRSATGFTLIELLLVVILLGLLAIVAIPRLASTGSDSKANTCRQNIAIINSQIELWAAQNGSQYPQTHGEFVAQILQNTDIFPDRAPACPYGNAYRYDPAKNRVIPHNHPRLIAEKAPIEQLGGEVAETPGP